MKDQKLLLAITLYYFNLESQLFLIIINAYLFELTKNHLIIFFLQLILENSLKLIIIKY